MPITPLNSRPGFGSATEYSYRNVFLEADHTEFLAGGGIIDGTSRDGGNTDNLFLLRPGLLMGRVTATKKWKPSLIGVTTVAYTSGGTSLTVSAAHAAELLRRVGASGTFNLYGAATAGGALTTTTVTYSAIDTGTGVITITDIGANRIAGSLVTAADGSQVPRSVIGDGMGVVVPSDSSDADWPHLPIGGVVESAKVLNWPADVTLQTFIKDSMAGNGMGTFTFNDAYSPA